MRTAILTASLLLAASCGTSEPGRSSEPASATTSTTVVRTSNTIASEGRPVLPFSEISDTVSDTANAISDEWLAGGESCETVQGVSEQAKCLWDINIDLCSRSETLLSENSGFINDTDMLNAGAEMANRVETDDSIPDAPEGFYSWSAARGLALLTRQSVCYHACRLWRDFSHPFMGEIECPERPLLHIHIQFAGTV